MPTAFMLVPICDPLKVPSTSMKSTKDEGFRSPPAGGLVYIPVSLLTMPPMVRYRNMPHATYVRRSIELDGFNRLNDVVIGSAPPITAVIERPSPTKFNVKLVRPPTTRPSRPRNSKRPKDIASIFIATFRCGISISFAYGLNKTLTAKSN